MPLRGAGTGLRAAFNAAHAAYRDQDPAKRDGLFVRALCDVLLNELRHPSCGWAVGGEPCGKPAQWFDDFERALCPGHLGMLKARLRAVRQRQES